MSKKRKGRPSRDRVRGGTKVRHDQDAATLARRYAEQNGQAETCGKRRYDTKGEATAAVGRTANHHNNAGGMNGHDGQHRLTVYRCAICAGRPYHLGHTPTRLL